MVDTGFVHEFDAAADVMFAWADALEQSPKTAKVFVLGTVKNAVEEMVERRIVSKVYPGPVKIPFKFKTPKSMRYYFGVVAKRDSEGKVIPYQRTGGLARNWEVIADENPLSIIIFHPGDADDFIIGERQQPGHVNTGYLNMALIILDIFIEAEDMIVDGWFSIIDFRSLI